MAQEETQRSGSAFWKVTAAIATLLLAGVVGVHVVERTRSWKVEDDAAMRAREAVTAEENARQGAAQAKTARAADVQFANAEHPERFKQFSPGDQVRVLGSAPDAIWRGLRSVVVLSSGVTDKESGVAWKFRCMVSILPRLRSESVLVHDIMSIDAEHLAKVGSPEEEKDLQSNPGLAQVIADQEKRITESDRLIEHINLDIQEGDPVVISEDDPRPALRGRRGRVLFVMKGNESDPLRTELPNYKVMFESMEVVQVKNVYLRPAPR